MIHDFRGTHIIADLYGISSERITKHAEISSTVENGIVKAGAHLIKTIVFAFDNGGFSLVSLLEESHVSIHTYPEFSSMFVDVFTCGKIDAMKIIEQIRLYFNPERIDLKTINRGFYK